MVINTKRMRGPAFHKSHDVKFRKTVLLNVVSLQRNEKEKAPEKKNIFAQCFLSNCVIKKHFLIDF